jgi:hypothetical protein
MSGPGFPIVPKMEDTDKSEAIAKVKNVAYNKNWNVVYFPCLTEEDECGDAAGAEKTAAPPQDLASMLRDDEQENEAASVAAGKATVWNKNTNIVFFKP